METASTLLLHIFLMFVGARLAGELCERLGQPAVVGELLIGIVVGPFALGWIGVPSHQMIDEHGSLARATGVLESGYEILAQLGVILLLFVVGLETQLDDILAVGMRAAVVAAGGITLTFGLVFGLGLMAGEVPIGAAFVATALVATSIGITARVLADLGFLDAIEARIILGAAIIDDVLAMIALTLVSAIGTDGGISITTLLVVVGEAVAFAAIVAFAGRHLVRRWGHRLTHLRMQNGPFSFATMLMLGLAVASTQVGLAAIIGAFLAGMVVSEIREEYDLERQTRPLYEFLVPTFFVVTGSRVDWRIFLDASLLGVALGLTLLCLVGKLLGCGLGALSLGRRSAAIVGVGMMPRGEVSLIVATAGRSLGLISGPMFSAVVVVVVLTTLIVPPCLTALARSRLRGSVGRPARTKPAVADADTS